MSLPTCKKNLTIKDVLSIINMCGASGVSELKYGDLFLSFKKEKGSSEIPLSSYPQNQVDKIKFDAQLFAAEEIRTKEDELANKIVENPAEYEDLLLAGDLEDVGEQDAKA